MKLNKNHVNYEELAMSAYLSYEALGRVVNAGGEHVVKNEEFYEEALLNAKEVWWMLSHMTEKEVS